MRLSSNYIATHSFNGVANARASLVDMYEQIASGKQVRKASDDPVFGARILDQQRSIADIEQSNRFVTISRNELENEESVLSQVSAVVMRARTLVLQGSTDSKSAADREVIANEINEIIDQISMLSNTKNSDGAYVFAGYKSDDPAYTFVRDANDRIISATYDGDSNSIVKTISPALKVETSHPGNQVFENGTVSMFDELIAARDALYADTVPGNLDQLDASIDTLTLAISDIGARMNIVDAAGELNDIMSNTLQVGLAKIRDLDLPTAIAKFTQLEVTVNAINNTFAKVAQTSLFNYIR